MSTQTNSQRVADLFRRKPAPVARVHRARHIDGADWHRFLDVINAARSLTGNAVHGAADGRVWFFNATHEDREVFGHTVLEFLREQLSDFDGVTVHAAWQSEVPEDLEARKRAAIAAAERMSSSDG